MCVQKPEEDIRKLTKIMIRNHSVTDGWTERTLKDNPKTYVLWTMSAGGEKVVSSALHVAYSQVSYVILTFPH